MGIGIILCATKTGGHLLPAVAVARELKRLDPDVDIHMVVSGQGMEDRILKGTNIPLHTLKVERLKGTDLISKARSMLKLPGAGLDSAKLIRELRAQVVVGFGGYTTGPLVLTAKALGKKTAILEANSIAGLTNRILGRFVDRVFIGFKEIGKFFPDSKTIVTGMPIRREIARVKKGSYTSRAKNILVFGGSQGSSFLNKHIPELLKQVSRKIGSISVIHQTGRTDTSETLKLYKELGMDASVVEYLDDMARSYQWADFVISRSGAGTIAELTAIGMPSLLIPFPYAADDHQFYNAKILEDAGAAVVVRESDFDLDSLSDTLIRLLRSKKQLNDMREAALSIGRPDAATVVAKEILSMVKG